VPLVPTCPGAESGLESNRLGYHRLAVDASPFPGRLDRSGPALPVPSYVLAGAGAEPGGRPAWPL
jgi:hypothetical protein